MQQGVHADWMQNVQVGCCKMEVSFSTSYRAFRAARAAGNNWKQRQHGAGVGRQDVRLHGQLPPATGAQRRRARRPRRAPPPPQRRPHHRLHPLLDRFCHDPPGAGQHSLSPHSYEFSCPKVCSISVGSTCGVEHVMGDTILLTTMGCNDTSRAAGFSCDLCASAWLTAAEAVLGRVCMDVSLL